MHHLAPADRAKAVAALATAVLLWGSAFVGIRAVVADGAYSPGQLSFARMLVASVCLLVLVGVRGGISIPHRRDALAFFVLGLFGQMLYHLLLNSGERSVDAGTASLLVSSAPLLSSALAVLLLGERLRAAGWVGTAIAFIGSATIAASAGIRLNLGSGALLVVIGTVLWAIYLVVQKTISSRYDSLALTAWPVWIGTVLLIPWSAGLPSVVATAPASSTLAVAWLGIMASVAGFVVYSYAMKRLPVVVASNALFTVPAAAIVIGAALLAERPTPLALAGAALSVAGVVLVQAKGHSRPVVIPVEKADAEAA